jgi:hypothetical protein
MDGCSSNNCESLRLDEVFSIAGEFSDSADAGSTANAMADKRAIAIAEVTTAIARAEAAEQATASAPVSAAEPTPSQAPGCSALPASAKATEAIAAAAPPATHAPESHELGVANPRKPGRPKGLTPETVKRLAAWRDMGRCKTTDKNCDEIAKAVGEELPKPGQGREELRAQIRTTIRRYRTSATPNLTGF